MYFKDIIGQEEIKKQLIKNVGSNRISHAYLFAESEGRGALGMAFAYAQFINCLDQTRLKDSCGRCSSCLKFQKIAHPDLHIFFPTATSSKEKKNISSKTYINQFREIILESHYLSLSQWYDKIGVEKKHAIINADDCNEIINKASIKPYENKFKIFIVWMVEKLYPKAAPKILKIVEEPPENTIFIFITHNPDKLPETILSRLQLIRFPPLSNLEIKNALINKYNCNEETASNISFMASGNFTEALHKYYLTQPDDIFYFFRDWLRSCYSLSTKEIFSHVEKISLLGREKQKAFLNYGLKIINECLLINYNANKPQKLFEEEADFLLKFSKFTNHKNIISVTNRFNESIIHIERNANSKIVFADLSFKLHKLLKYGSK